MAELQETIDTLKEQVTEVTANDSMSEAARKSLLKDLIAVLEHEAGSRSGEDIEDVHDMRVATRRMRSVMMLLAAYFRPKTVDRFRKRLKRVATTLGTVRDLDVMIDNLQKFRPSLVVDAQQDLDAAIDLLKQQREKARDRLTATLDKAKYQRLLSDFRTFVTTPNAEALVQDHANGRTPTEARYVLPIEIYSHLALVRAYDAILPEADEPTLHQLRIEIKRLRYLLSVFDDVLNTSGKEFIGELKQLQDHLGVLHDSVVAQQQLGGLKDNLSESQIAALQIYLNTLAGQANSLKEKFPDAWRHFNSRSVQRELANALASL